MAEGIINRPESMLALQQEVLGISDYSVIWITFWKGLVIGYLRCWFVLA